MVATPSRMTDQERDQLARLSVLEARVARLELDLEILARLNWLEHRRVADQMDRLEREPDGK